MRLSYSVEYKDVRSVVTTAMARYTMWLMMFKEGSTEAQREAAVEEVVAEALKDFESKGYDVNYNQSGAV